MQSYYSFLPQLLVSDLKIQEFQLLSVSDKAQVLFLLLNMSLFESAGYVFRTHLEDVKMVAARFGLVLKVCIFKRYWYIQHICLLLFGKFLVAILSSG